ncbi:MAG TPA: hypothetical protein DD803_04940 [Alcaligenes faecalis]|nr:hypothetical protein [Alcaligenes faecalis]HBQ88790.1 hypothetical protein [Alcaligenes faecalis]
MKTEPVIQLSWIGISVTATIITMIASGVTWFSTKAYEEGRRAAEYQYLTNELAGLRSVDKQRAEMKERAELAESGLRNLQSEAARLNNDFLVAQEQLAKAHARLSSAEKCAYLEKTAQSSAAHLATATTWANQASNGYDHSFYKEAAARNAQDLSHLTACLTSSGS